jgi:hypothetical protein
MAIHDAICRAGRLTNEYRAAFDPAKYQYSPSALRACREVSDALIASQKLSAVEEQHKSEVSGGSCQSRIHLQTLLSGRPGQLLMSSQLL